MGRITVEDIKVWFNHGMKKNATHLIVKSDNFSHEYYPVYASNLEEARKADEDDNKGNDPTIEVYNLAIPFEKQVTGSNQRTRNF